MRDRPAGLKHQPHRAPAQLVRVLPRGASLIPLPRTNSWIRGLRQPSLAQAVLRLAFRLRGFHGSVRVLATTNDDPARGGYHLLGIDQAIVDAAHGHPVVQATVDFPAEGYAAELAC